jgi:hypothetical protein
MPHLSSTSNALRAAIFYFKVTSGRIITEIPMEVPLVAMLKMGLSHLLDIWEGGVGDVN